MQKLEKQKKIAALKKIFSEDIILYAKFFFGEHATLESPDFHREIVDLYNSGHDRIALSAPRGHAKSTVTNLIYLSWLVVHEKEKFILLVSDTFTQASMFLDTIRLEFEGNDRLKAFYGDMTSKEVWNSKEIIVNGVMIKALGAGMKVRGLKFGSSRPTLISLDDLENDELVESKARREKLERWFNGALIPSLGKGGRVIMIGTILHYDSLLFNILKKDKYTEFKTKTYRAIQKDGTALWPEHLNIDDLLKIKNEYISKGQGYLFYQEYLNDPISEENRKFHIEKMNYFEEKDLFGKILNTYIAIDRAYSLAKTADHTGIVVVSVDTDNYWYVRLAERFKGTEGQLIEKIFDLKSYFKPKSIGIEQKAFEYTIKPALQDEMRKRSTFFSIEELKDGGVAKTLRIEGLVPRFESDTIYLKRDQTDLIDELIKFPKAMHDDLSDALAHMTSIAKAPMSKSRHQPKAKVKNPYLRR